MKVRNKYQDSDANLYAYYPSPLGRSAKAKSADVDGPEFLRPATEGGRAELMSHERADTRVRDATEQARLAYAADPQKSKKDVGTVAAGVIDRRTGKVFTAHNDRNGVPENMHPIISERVAEMRDSPAHFSLSGSHAEIHALNSALIAREASGVRVIKADLGEFTIKSVWTRGESKRMSLGADAPQCGNCSRITRGTRNLSGKCWTWWSSTWWSMSKLWRRPGCRSRRSSRRPRSGQGRG